MVVPGTGTELKEQMMMINNQTPFVRVKICILPLDLEKNASCIFCTWSCQNCVVFVSSLAVCIK